MAYVGTVTTEVRYNPAWAGDFGSRDHLLPGGSYVVPSQFLAETGTKITLSAEALADATSISVLALRNPVPSGTLMHFGQSKEFARSTADAAAGATSITVEALPSTIESGDSFTYVGTGPVYIPSGTLLGRTFAEAASNVGFGPAADADEEFYLLMFDITDATKDADATLYRHGSVVKTNKLPEFSGLSSALQAKIRSLYTCVLGGA